MMLSAAGTILTAFVAAQAATLPGLTPNLYNRELSARQDVPAQCVRSCQPVNAQLQNNCPPVNCCTATFVQGYVSCYVCVASAAGVTDYSEGEATLTALVEACNDRGLPVDPVPFPRPQSGTSTTSSGASTSTTSTTPTSTSTAASTTSTISQSTVTSLTAPVPTSTTSRSTVTSIDPTSVPTPGATEGSNTGGNGAVAVGLGVTATWLLPLLGAGMGLLLA